MTPSKTTQAQSPTTPEGTLVGTDFAKYPYISALGVLFRVSRLHEVPKEMIYRYLGVRIARYQDIASLLLSSEARKEELAKRTSCDPVVRRYWDIGPWLPFSSSLEIGGLSTIFRICPCCARTGYHTVLFHLPWIERCPWHGEALISICRSCARPLLSQITEGVTPLQCSCGIDYFDRKLALRGDRKIENEARNWINEYLIWARRSSLQNYLIAAPHLQQGCPLEIAAIVHPPTNLRDSFCATRHLGPRCQARTIAPKDLCRQSVDDQGVILALRKIPVAENRALDIPSCLLRPLRAVAQNIVEKLPQRTFFEGDLLRIYPNDDPHHSKRPAGSSSRLHSEITFLPVLRTSDGGVLDCASIDKSVRVVIRELTVDVVDRMVVDQGAAAISELSPEQLHLVATLAKQVLLRAYAQGMRSILSRHVGAIYDLPRDRPRLRQPLLSISLDAPLGPAAKVVWAPQQEIGGSSRQLSRYP